jgi:hypothetical protein
MARDERIARTASVVLMLAVAGCADKGPVTPALTADGLSPFASHVDFTQTTFLIEPFEGVPGNAADDLTRKIAEVGKREGVTFVQRLGATATYRLKGYLTAVGNPTSTTVVYVYDIIDAGGRRVFRFTGQEPSNGTSGDPWSAVSDDTTSIIAERTVASIKAWLARGVGAPGSA